MELCAWEFPHVMRMLMLKLARICWGRNNADRLTDYLFMYYNYILYNTHKKIYRSAHYVDLVLCTPWID